MGTKGMFGKNKLIKEEKQLRKQYFKMVKKHQKKLDTLNKVAHKAPWDWNFGLDYLIAYMEFMRDYYNLGWNIFQSEDSLVSLKKSLDATLEAYKQWEKYTLEHPVNADNLEKFNSEYKKARNKFFKLLGEHIEEWWD